MKAKVTFTRCVQDSQEYGSNNEYMVSRVFFDLEIGGQIHRGLHADLKQVVGSHFETGDIEVGKPEGYPGPFNHVAFRDAAESYFRSLVGAAGRGIQIKGASKVRMMNNTFDFCQISEFEVDGSTAGAW